MVGTRTKQHIKVASIQNKRWSVFIKKQGEVLLLERSHAQEQYMDYNHHINGLQWYARPQRP